MIRSSLRSLAVIASIACMAVASTAVAAFDRVRGAIKSAWNWIQDISPIAIKQPKPKCEPALEQTAMKVITKMRNRNRPTVMARWRMCPST